MSTNDNQFVRLFFESSRTELLGPTWSRLRECVTPLTEEQVWWRPNEASNSIGNLLLHLDGNVRQWLVASFDKLKDERNRPAEFNATSTFTAAEPLDLLRGTLDEASQVLGRLTEEDLLAPFEIQGHKVRGLDAVYQVVEHFGMHYGQILYITKYISGKDLGFYRHLNKTGRPE